MVFLGIMVNNNKIKIGELQIIIAPVLLTKENIKWSKEFWNVFLPRIKSKALVPLYWKDPKSDRINFVYENPYENQKAINKNEKVPMTKSWKKNKIKKWKKREKQKRSFGTI